MFLDALFLTICWLCFLAAVSWVVGLLIFAPLNEKTLLFQVNNRYRISDILILAGHVQLSAGALFALTPSASPEEKAALLVSAFLLLLFWWMNGVRMLARAGVEYTWHRWLFLGVIMPVGYLAGLCFTPAIVFLPYALALIMGSFATGEIEGFLQGVSILAAFGVAIATAAACYRICRKIADRAREDRAGRDGITFGETANHKTAPRSPPTRIRATTPVDSDGIWIEESKSSEKFETRDEQ